MYRGLFKITIRSIYNVPEYMPLTVLQILRTLYIIVVNETRSIIKVSKETDRAVNGDTSTTYHSNLQRLFRFLE